MGLWGRVEKLPRWVAPGEELQGPGSGGPAIPAIPGSRLTESASPPTAAPGSGPLASPPRLRLPLPTRGGKALRLTATAAPSVCVAAGEAAAPSLLPPPPGQLGRSRAPLPSLAH